MTWAKLGTSSSITSGVSEPGALNVRSNPPSMIHVSKLQLRQCRLLTLEPVEEYRVVVLLLGIDNYQDGVTGA